MWSCFSCCSSSAKTRELRSASGYRSTTDRGAASLYFEDAYELLELLGEGKTGKVYRVRAHQSPRFEAAAKVVRKQYLSTPQRRIAFDHELDVLKRLRHPSVVKLLDIFEDAEQFVVVTERVHGGGLLDVVCAPHAPPLRECDVAFIIHELLSATAYLHKQHVTHRDIKLDNVMCHTTDLRDGIVLIDFGLAQCSGRGELTGMNGTVHYMAPEVFGRDSRYGNEVDIWAIAVLTFVLLFGRFPFDANFMSQVEDQICAGAYELPRELVGDVSPQAVKFIEYLMVTNPQDRPPAALALQHPWMQIEHVSTRPFSDAHMAQLRAFYNARKPPR